MLLGTKFSEDSQRLINLRADLMYSVALLSCRLLNGHIGTFLDWGPLCGIFCCSSINYDILAYGYFFFHSLTIIMGTSQASHSISGGRRYDGEGEHIRSCVCFALLK